MSAEIQKSSTLNLNDEGMPYIVTIEGKHGEPDDETGFLTSESAVDFAADMSGLYPDRNITVDAMCGGRWVGTLYSRRGRRV